jgi:acyl-coenzyme A synthetase/AMP-(fatty) acid ligase
MIDLPVERPGTRPVDRPVVMLRGSEIRWAELSAAAHALAGSLPSGPAAVNLCERRENFVVSLLALLIREQTCLLPPSRALAVVSEVLAAHPGAYSLDDSLVAASRTQPLLAAGAAIEPPVGRVVLVGYTSGSTGRPTANPKTWGSLLASARLNSGALRATLSARGETGMPWILATVPSQHMYGIETTVLLPILGGMGIHAAHPLYPADIASALRELPGPRVLVTTPVHLRALLHSGVELPPLGAIVSATAPLAPEVARSTEERYGTTVLELFGSTETCVIATRRTAHDQAWQPYAGMELVPQAEGTTVSAPWLPEPVVLHDVLELRGDGTFVVVGRNADMVEVAGKRASLADLTRRLMSVPGVTDAVVFQPEADRPGHVRRLAALAVAEGLTEAAIFGALAQLTDPVFLPRPLVLVKRLPRNEVGKLPREQLLAAIRR